MFGYYGYGLGQRGNFVEAADSGKENYINLTRKSKHKGRLKAQTAFIVYKQIIC